MLLRHISQREIIVGLTCLWCATQSPPLTAVHNPSPVPFSSQVFCFQLWRTGSIRGTWNPQSVISRQWQRFQDDCNLSRCYSTGPPRITTPNEDRIYLAVTAKRNRRSTAPDLSRQLSSATCTAVSRQTVYRRLGHIGLYARRPVRCVSLTATHCHLRLTWSREYALWTPQQWSCVMFSDESRFSFQSDSYRTLIWRAPGTRYHQEKNIERHRYGGAGWLAFGEELFLVPELTCMFRV
ncbi:HTH_Tnp_Tc3_2 domain-containing protein [Trichonephila clavipes]|nr:HTH_Tnp_Tc3_2 domain-containing protein [Trichonephila clavipes]